MSMDEEYLPTTPTLKFPPQDMVLSVAMGLEDPQEIASRYGYSDDEWQTIAKWKPFVDAVAKHRAELEASGWTFKTLAKGLTQQVFEDAYKIAISNDSTLLQKLEFVKLGAKLADMEPKANTQVASGPGFSINIHFSKPRQEAIDVDVKEVAQEEDGDESP